MKVSRTMRCAYDVIVVGGGAAGLLAAGEIAQGGAEVALFEKMEKTARKVRITGKGRCNVTNDRTPDEIVEKVRAGRDFVRYSIETFSPQAVQHFFTEQGVELSVEQGARVFPKSGDAWEIAGALDRFARNSGVDVVCHAPVQELIVREGRVVGVEVSLAGHTEVFMANCVLIATGGVSYPSTGSTGDGYHFAHEAGHAIEPIRPSLVPLALRSPYLRVLDGVRLKNVSLSLVVDGTVEATEFGEMEFFSFGIGGALTLRISRMAVDALIDHRMVAVVVDFKPSLSTTKLLGRIERELIENKLLSVEALVRKMVPAKIVLALVKESGLKPYDSAEKLTSKQREMLVDTLKGMRFEVSDYRSFKEAIVTAGGVDTSQIDATTMMSKHVEGLYFAGEVLDIDADTGGYNLQLAFSTAHCAACNIIKHIKE